MDLSFYAPAHESCLRLSDADADEISRLSGSQCHHPDVVACEPHDLPWLGLLHQHLDY